MTNTTMCLMPAGKRLPKVAFDQITRAEPFEARDPITRSTNDVTVHASASRGTGFTFATGRIATNAHVVGDASLAEVESQDGTRFKAKVVAKDVDCDFAILQFAEGVRPVATLVPLKRSGAPEIGEGVVVIGSPLGLKGTVTTGIVSQVYSSGEIQLKASANPGNSGGPVVDMQGRGLCRKGLVALGRGRIRGPW
jgi:S1-C subfamily serine protease